MACVRCQGLMVQEWWQSEEGARGFDWKCVQCGARKMISADTGYTPERPLEAVGRWVHKQ